MRDLTELLVQAAAGPLGTVVHVGAGDGDAVDRYRSLDPARLVLIEGDPEAGAGLRRRADLAAAAVEAICVPVTATGGPVSWRRYNLPALNGPIDAATLTDTYPRLRTLAALSLEARPLAGLLAALQVARTAGRPNVLVLDAPGQERELLESLPPEQLREFDLLALRGCRRALDAGGAPLARTLEDLQARAFVPLAVDADGEPLWPIALLRFDRERDDSERRRAELVRLSEALQERDEQLAELAALHAAALEAAREHEAGARLQRLAAEELAGARAELAARLAAETAQVQQLRLGQGEAAAELERLAAELDETRRAHASAVLGLERLAQARDEQAGVLVALEQQVHQLREAASESLRSAEQRDAEAAGRIAELQSALQLRMAAKDAELAGLREVLTQEQQALADALARLEREIQDGAGQARLAAEREARLAGAEQQLAALAAERDAWLKEKPALAAARDEQAKLASERAALIEALEPQKAALAAEREAWLKEKPALAAARDEQTRLASERKAQLEGLEKQLAALAAEREAWLKEKPALVAARDEKTKLAADRSTLIEALEKQKAGLAAERDAWLKEKPTLIAARDEQARLQREARQRTTQVEAELADTAARYALLKEELTKVEAQIELIVDLVLRQPAA